MAGKDPADQTSGSQQQNVAAGKKQQESREERANLLKGGRIVREERVREKGRDQGRRGR